MQTQLTVIDGMTSVDGKQVAVLTRAEAAKLLKSNVTYIGVLVDHGKVREAGFTVVEVSGRVVPRSLVYADDVLAYAKLYQKRDDENAKQRFELKMRPETMDKALNDLLGLVAGKDVPEVIELIIAIQNSKNITARHKAQRKAARDKARGVETE